MALVRTESRKVSKQSDRFVVGMPPELAKDLGITEGFTAHWHKVLTDDGILVKDQAVLVFTKNEVPTGEDGNA